MKPGCQGWQQWLTHHANYRPQQWRHVWFNDEWSRFLLYQHERHLHVYQHWNERFPCSLHPRDSGTWWWCNDGVGSHQPHWKEWYSEDLGQSDCSSLHYDSPCPSTSPETRCIAPTGQCQAPHYQGHSGLFQQEQYTDTFLALKFVIFKPKEHIGIFWTPTHLKNQVIAPSTPDKLFLTLKQELQAIPIDTIHHLITSMPRRCTAVLRQQGVTLWKMKNEMFSWLFYSTPSTQFFIKKELPVTLKRIGVLVYLKLKLLTY